MLDDRPSPPQAALPLVSLVAGLLLAGSIVNTWTFLAGISAVIILLGLRGGPRATRSAIVAACLLVGILVGQGEMRGKRRDLHAVSRIGTERFATIRGQIVRDWEPTEEGGHRLELKAFEILTAPGIPISGPLTIYSMSAPPDAELAQWVVVEGFLQSGHNAKLSMSVKSLRLISYQGRIRCWTPRCWNRRINHRLVGLARRDPPRSRPIALVRAVALGRSESLPAELRESYRRGGIYHLLVFSGMQIAIAAGFLVWLFRLIRAPRCGDATLLVLALLAPSFAGDAPSVSRSSWMIGLYAASRMFRRPTSLENLLFVSAFLRLLVHPSELSDPGFALTYAATGGLILIGKPLARRAAQRWLAALLYSAGAEIATTALTLHFFHQFVLGGSVITLLAAPIITVMLGISALSCVTILFSENATTILLDGIVILDTACGYLTSAVSALELSGFAAAPTAEVVIGAALSSLAAVTCLRGGLTRLIILCLLSFAPIIDSRLVVRTERSRTGFRIEFLDVGQGDAILLRHGNRAILVDGGGRQGDSRFGRKVLLPLLLDRGVSRLEVLALSHPHPDHCGGLQAILETVPVGELWLSNRHANEPCTRVLLSTAARRQTTALFVGRARRIERGGFLLDPLTTRLKLKRSPMNNSSLVLRVQAGTRSLLLSGDLERDGEQMLAEEESCRIQADILKVAHHGSKSSSTPEFLETVAPRLAVISSGRRNQFGHPHESVLEELARRGIRPYRTDLQGTITLTIIGNKIFVEPEFDTPR